MISIKTKDGDTVQVTKEIRNMAKLIDEALTQDEDEDNAEVTLADVETADLKLIIEYCDHFKFAKTETEIKKPLISKDPKIYITDEYEREFVGKLSFDTICGLYSAVNVLNVPPLFELLAATIAAFFKGKTFEDLKKEFALPDDLQFTPEDEKQILAENAWIEAQAKEKVEKLKQMIAEREEAEKNNK